MKVLICNSAGQSAHYWSNVGLAKALSSIGYEVKIWELSQKSAFDSFDEFEPDLFIGQTYNVDEALIKCISQRPLIKVSLKASDYGYFNEKTDQDSPVVRVNDKELALMHKLRMSMEIDNLFLFIHYHPDYINFTHNGWGAEGYKVRSLMNASDLYDYYNGSYVEEYKCDIGFVGGYWQYKSQVLDRYLLPLCETFEYKIKIFGNGHWPVPQYHGFIQTEHVKHLFRSSKVCPNLHEPHSQMFGYDIVERPFKILSSGGFCLSDYVEGLEKLFPEGIVFANSQREFSDLARYYINIDDEERKNISEKGRELVLKDHTYFDRANDLLSWFNIDKKDKLIGVKNEIICNWC